MKTVYTSDPTNAKHVTLINVYSLKHCVVCWPLCYYVNNARMMCLVVLGELHAVVARVHYRHAQTHTQSNCKHKAQR